MDVPELVPMDDYDAKQASLEASIKWLALRAFGRQIPSKWQEPFQEHMDDTVTLKSDLEPELTSGDLYCRVCGAIFRKEKTTWKSVGDVIQALSRRGFYVTDMEDTVVTEKMLQKPFRASAHIALAGALMAAYSAEVVTVERVVQAVKQFTSFAASSELPYDTEDALLFWLNKVCGAVRQQLDQGRPLESHRNSQRMDIPIMDDLLKDINDGCCLATLISFYCPNYLRMSDIYLHRNPGIADSLCNIQLIGDFCQGSLPVCPLVLTINDLFYTHYYLKAPLVAFLSELFYWFEVERAPCVRDVTKPLVSVGEGEGDGGGEGDCDGDGDCAVDEADSRPTTAKQLRSLSRPPVPISNATKRSFSVNSGPVPGDMQALDSNSSPDLRRDSGSGLRGPRQPLLPRRLQQRNSIHTDDGSRVKRQLPTPVVGKKRVYKPSTSKAFRRSRSLPSVEEVDVGNGTRESMRAWEDQEEQGNHHGNPRGHRTNSHYLPQSSTHSTLTNVTHSDDSQSTLLSNVSIDTEADLDLTADTSLDMSEYEGTPRDPSRGPSMVLESISARTNSARTARNNGRGNGHIDPLMPAQLRPSKEKASNHTKEVESGECSGKKKSPTSPSKPKSLTLRTGDSSSGDSTPDEEYKTPSSESAPLPGERRLRSPAPSKVAPSSARGGKPYEAFYINSVPGERQEEGASFTLHKTPMTREAAQAAGIPVIDSFKNSSTAQSGSRDGLDRELQKIHADHHDKENKALKDSFFLNAGPEQDKERPGTLEIAQFPMDRSISSISSDERPSPKTSFAQIKKAKDSGEVSPIVYTQIKGPQKGALKGGNPGSAKGPKKTTFATLPNTTTWQESAQKKAMSPDTNSEAGSDTVEPLPSELIDIRLRLEERRRQIEMDKRRMQAEMSKQRQQVGKQAFIQVVTKPKDDGKDVKESAPVSKPKVTPAPAEPPQKTTESAPPAEPPQKAAVSAVDRYKDAKHQGYREKLPTGREEKHKEEEPVEPLTSPERRSSHGAIGDEMEQERKATKPLQRSESARSPVKSTPRKKESSRRIDSPPEPGRRRTSETPPRVDHSPESPYDSPPSQPKSRSRRRSESPERRVEKSTPSKRKDSPPPRNEKNRPRRSASPLDYEKSREAYRSESPADSYRRPHSPTRSDDEGRDRRDRDESPSSVAKDPRLNRLDSERRNRSGSDPRLERTSSERYQKKEDEYSSKSKPRSITRSESDRRSRSSTDPSRRFSSSPGDGRSRRSARHWSPPSEIRLARDDSGEGDVVEDTRMSRSYDNTAEVEREIERERRAREKLDRAESKLRGRSSSPADLYRRGSPGRMTSSDYVVRHKDNEGNMSKSEHSEVRGESAERKGSDYGSSLDKLNCSLTELQGEIMRLSLQRDHLKGDADAAPAGSPSRTEPSPPKDPYYMYNQTGGEPDIAGTGRIVNSGMYGHPSSMGYQPPNSMYGMQAPYQPPAPHPFMTPYMGQTGYPPPMVPQHQFTTNPLYQPQGPMYPQPPGGYPAGQWPPHMQPYVPPPPISSSSHYPNTNTVNSHRGELPSPSTTLPHQPSISHTIPEPAKRSTPPSPLGVTTDITSPDSHSSAPSQRSPLVASSPERGWSAMSPEPKPPPLEVNDDSHSGGEGDAPLSPSAAPDNKGFFIAFEAESPRRQKPKLLRDKKIDKKDTPAKNRKAPPVKSETFQSHVGPSESEPPAPPPVRPQTPPNQAPPQPVAVASPGVGFVIGAEQTAQSPKRAPQSPKRAPQSPKRAPQSPKRAVQSPKRAPKTPCVEVEAEEAEIERRKQKLLQQTAKRREEMEKKRLKTDRDRQKKMEEQRIKEELAEQKKAEEKARREEIFQQYQQRKAEEAAAEQNAKDPPVVRRAKPKARPKRPMSQPPVSLEDKHSQSSSSQEDIYARGGNGMSNSAHCDINDGNSLAFGGATHRRPPSPEKRFTHEITPPFLIRAIDYKGIQPSSTPPKKKRPSFSDTASEAGSLISERAGERPSYAVDLNRPKLFVKPSAKSNRHIIHNAISHCCLAGTVNSAVKQKTLDELSRSEDKHFIILFRDGGQQYRSIYCYRPEREEIVKLIGTGPKSLTNDMMNRFYKYNSGAKSFQEIVTTKHISVSIDAVVIQNHYWQKKNPAAKRPTTGLY